MSIEAHPEAGLAERWRKKPVVIDAVRCGGRIAWRDIAEWCGGTVLKSANGRSNVGIIIPTLEGDMHADAGDWIIRGVQGEFYSCKPDIFAATYERASDAWLARLTDDDVVEAAAEAMLQRHDWGRPAAVYYDDIRAALAAAAAVIGGGSDE